MKTLTLSLATILATSTFAFAGGDIAPVEPMIETPVVIEDVVSDSGVYVGLAYSLLKSDSDFDNNHDLGADYSAIMFQGGYKFNEYIAVEGRYWLGLTDEAFDNPLHHAFLDDFDTEGTAWGVYVKPMYPVTDALDVYALLGYGSASANGITLNDGSIHDLDVDGFSWGIGAAYSFTDNISVFADYVDFQDDTLTVTSNALSGTFDHAFDAINLGVTYKF